MKLLISILLAATGMYTTSIYTHTVTTTTGQTISLAQYQGKKILLVAIASEADSAATQIPALQELYRRYKDSLVVIGFPSTDFGKEPRSNEALKLLMANTYHADFPLSVLTGLKDGRPGTHPVFHWLQQTAENGVMNAPVNAPFDKFLIDQTGTLIGVFSDKVSPLSADLINAITQP